MALLRLEPKGCTMFLEPKGCTMIHVSYIRTKSHVQIPFDYEHDVVWYETLGDFIHIWPEHFSSVRVTR